MCLHSARRKNNQNEKVPKKIFPSRTSSTGSNMFVIHYVLASPTTSTVAPTKKKNGAQKEGKIIQRKFCELFSSVLLCGAQIGKRKLFHHHQQRLTRRHSLAFSFVSIKTFIYFLVRNRFGSKSFHSKSFFWVSSWNIFLVPLPLIPLTTTFYSY